MVNGTNSVDEMRREFTHVPSKYFVANDIFYRKEIREEIKKCGIEKVITISLTDGIPMGLNGDRVKYKIIEKLKGINKSEFNGSTLINFEQLLTIGKGRTSNVEACHFVPNKKVTIAYTSGSTGNSKACVASWERLDSMIQIMGMTEIMFTTFPLWIYYSLLNMIHEPLSLGVTLALDPLFDPKNMKKRNEQYKFNHWLTIPPYLKTVVDAGKKIDCRNWKIVVTGGDELQEKLKIRADNFIKNNGGTAHVEQGYGASEVLGSFSYGYKENTTVGSVGVPCVGNMIKILDEETKEPVKLGETGIGYLYTAARMDGYYNDEEATKHNLIVDEHGVTWYNTEDLLHQNEKGELFLDGRIRRIVLTLDSNGNPAKIIPTRTKKSIIEMSQVSNCEVITVPDDSVVNVAVAFVVTNNIVGDESLKTKIMEHCFQSIPEYMVPKEIYFVDQIPMTLAKKPDIKKLKTIYQTEIEQKKVKKKILH